MKLYCKSFSLIMIIVIYFCISTIVPTKLDINTIYSVQSNNEENNESSNNSTAGNETNSNDYCSYVHNNLTPWMCVYLIDDVTEFPSGTSSIGIIVEGGNLPENYTWNYQLMPTGDVEWNLPVHDGNKTPDIDGRVFQYSTNDVGTNFTREFGDFDLKGLGLHDGCYSIGVRAQKKHQSTFEYFDLIPLTQGQPFKIGNADCSSTDFLKINGWNDTTIAEYEIEDSDDSSVPGFTFISVFSAFCFVALYKKQRVSP